MTTCSYCAIGMNDLCPDHGFGTDVVPTLRSDVLRELEAAPRRVELAQDAYYYGTAADFT